MYQGVNNCVNYVSTVFRDREERLATLNAHLELQKQELQKKIKQKVGISFIVLY